LSRTLVVFVEESSAKTLLDSILPRILPGGVRSRVVHFEGKSDLEKQLVKRLRGWREPNTSFVVLRDQDSGDCREVKAKIQSLCGEAGRSDAVVRIACHELESWYLGDLNAVEAGLGIHGLARMAEVSKFRDPDRLNNAAQELKALTKGAYQKVGGSRRIAPHMDLSGANRSSSFRVFCEGIHRICST
jgi:hypothetical protein